ncbi:MAG: hypothetical protein WBN40_00595 [Pseudomonadales bacterium]
MPGNTAGAAGATIDAFACSLIEYNIVKKGNTFTKDNTFTKTKDNSVKK